VKRIREGIYQIITPFPEFQRDEAYRLRDDLESHPRVTKSLPYVLPYFIASRGDNLLVDCGWNTDDALQAVKEQLSDTGGDISELQNLLLTHAHPDHCGLAGRLKDETGCTVYMHEAEIPFLQSRYAAPADLLQRMDEWFGKHGVSPDDKPEIERGSMPMRFFVSVFEPDTPLKGGEQIQVGDFSFEVIWTPGHAPGHVCLYEQNHRILLSGDHVLPKITPNVSLHPQQRENPLADFLESLEKVGSLKVERMLPAHEWDIDWFKKRIEELKVHHLQRLDEMLEAVGKDGAVTATDVARRVHWATGTYESFSGWMKRAAIGETLSHLRYLVSEGRLQEKEQDGLVLFQAS
jgi:glyoxylase-like metal-dependent hydrolase (beta-lactamase superfamily II)